MLEGGCSVPVGALAQLDGERMRLHGIVAAVDGVRVVAAEMEGHDAIQLGRGVAELLLRQGAKEILDATH